VTPGETAVIVLEVLTETLEAGNSTIGLTSALPDSSTNSTAAPLKNPVPAMVTEVPPAVEPWLVLLEP